MVRQDLQEQTFVPELNDPISERLSRANMNKIRVCVFHVRREVATQAPARVLGFFSCSGINV